MNSQKQLGPWIDFLQNQIVALDAAHLAKTGEPHVANATLVAFLKVNDEMAREKIERAVAAFGGDSESWPPSLTGDQIVNLTHRANSAKGLLQAIVSGKLPRNTPKALRAPPAQNRSQFIKWLFVDLWKLGGSAYLEGLTNSYLSDPIAPHADCRGDGNGRR
jgi:hypothetical protein